MGCFGCEPCTGVLCTEDIYGDPRYGQRPVAGNDCACENCPEYYSCPADYTPVTLVNVTVPDGIAVNAQTLLLLDSWSLDDYWGDRCSETCIPCGEELCEEIGQAVGTPLYVSTSDPCT